MKPINYETKQLWNQEAKKLWSQETKTPRNQETKKLRNQEAKRLWNQETKKPINQETKQPRSQDTKKPRNSLPLNIPTPTPAPDNPLGGHERTWGTRDEKARKLLTGFRSNRLVWVSSPERKNLSSLELSRANMFGITVGKHNMKASASRPLEHRNFRQLGFSQLLNSFGCF